MVTRKYIERVIVNALESIIGWCARQVDRVHNWAS